MLVRLIYASRVQKTFVASDVRDILDKSVRNNARVGLSGALVFTGDVFLQCLEGHRRDVNATYNRILNDPRHTDPSLLVFDEVPSREFTEWNMGYLGYTAENRALFLKYSPTTTFDPYAMSSGSLRAFFGDIVARAHWLKSSPQP